ncbi:hypothetical protein A9K55_006742 [Cordyceps militaris]|uniref:F-box domain-containing protein n=1 Tax=Cordyceps militaris TaxID=73501 RepID=A0A2H4SDR5_CORMI|nr:hypothetical protein A9K55_006742 [Cordyceps militaris]
MADSASRRALSIPEILLNILNACTKDTLLAAVRVNRLWFDCGIGALWAVNDFLETAAQLAAIKGKERRQLYANCIKDLSVHEQNTHLYAGPLKDVEFPALNFVHLEHSRPGQAWLFSRVFTPTVKVLKLFAVKLGDYGMPAIASRMGHLTHLIMGGSGCYAGGMAAFLGACRSLQYLDVHGVYQIARQFPTECFIVLASLPSLEVLHYEGDLSADSITRAATVVAEPFIALKLVVFKVQPQKVPGLLHGIAQLPQLCSLQLDLDCKMPDLRNLSQLQKLRSFALMFKSAPRMRKEDLAPVKALTALEYLTIDAENWFEGLINPGMPDLMKEMDLQELVLGLGKLHKLRLTPKADIGVTFLQHLAKYCPLLTSCAMLTLTLSLRELEGIEPIAPNKWFCQALSVGLVENNFREEADIDSAVALILEKLPTVRRFDFLPFDFTVPGLLDTDSLIYKFQQALNFAIRALPG